MAELTAEQKALQEKLKVLVSPLVADIVDEKMKKFAEGNGTNRIRSLLGDDPDHPAAVQMDGPNALGQYRARRGEKRGLDAARFMWAIAASKMTGRSAMEIAASKFGAEHRVTQQLKGAQEAAAQLYGTKAPLAAQSGVGGGFLLPEPLAAEVIEFLRPASAVRQLEPVIMPMDAGTLRIPKLATGSAAAYVGENVNMANAQPVFGQVIPTAKKLAALIPISNDLIRRGGPGVDTLLRDDLVAAIAQRSDLAFIRGDGTQAQPKGLLNWILAAENIVSNATVNTANVIADLGKLIQALADANVRFIRPGWIMSNRTWRYLYTLLTTVGAFIFRDEMNNGTLFGMPFARTSQIPNNLAPGGTGSELYLADFADVVIGESTGILIDVSTEAAYFDGANVQAAFSQDQMVLRALIEHDLVMRHNESVAELSQVIWL